MAKEKIVIVGIGEIADVATDYFQRDSDYEVCAYAAERAYIDKKLPDRVLAGCPVVDVETLTESYPPKQYKLFVAMAYGKLNHDRRNMYLKLKGKGYSFVSYISSRAYISSNVSIGENCFILEDNVIQRNVSIGNNVFLWSGNHIGHRTTIHNHVFLSSHVAISGFCVIGESCFLGINSALGDCVNVAENCFIGGGVALMHDTKPGDLYRVPALKPEKLGTKLVFGFK
ncbi:acetyltransferase [Selenomonas ruminantium]|uniref:Sugar O-acyltransferase, sialic acid O-acetyltransferase NeuD family n=1 Tax=Selenomonas ruminantium TaxID=971 RepID=A0A1K1PJM2_SELRU|nr:acetyltransferase [Selenomonas ruminantium]SFW47645.1 sugar O-acyltransferase, sialic acid O-acetyltransferase NeuD family [Selenomonas ruminantium]